MKESLFYGTYRYKVDEKGRMPLPGKFREQLKDSRGGKLAKGAEKSDSLFYRNIIRWFHRVG